MSVQTAAATVSDTITENITASTGTSVVITGLVDGARVNWEASLATVVVGDLPDWDYVLERLRVLLGQLMPAA